MPMASTATIKVHTSRTPQVRTIGNLIGQPIHLMSPFDNWRAS